jgi:hypothetical protein
MNAAERKELRALQDRWLALPHIQARIRAYGEDEPIALGFPGCPWPTYRQIQEALHPELRSWFEDFFREE